MWEDLEALALVEPGAGHATWMVRRDGNFLGWYVNLQRPIVRTSLGFDTSDLALDVIIRPDLVTYQWKDEDELAEDVERGFVTTEEGKAIRAEGEGVIETARGQGPPFGDGWEAWQPDASRVVPKIPDGWDRV
jgi:predicted RNA-binding protein associated with RNAse of E/G family